MIYLKGYIIKVCKYSSSILEIDDFKFPLSVKGACVHHVQ